MHPLVKKVRNIIGREGLLAAGDRCLVAVSAGPDSMALLHILAVLAPEFNTSLVAAYVDHGLRPAETGAEAELVRQAARALGLPVECGKVAVRSHSAAHGLSLEHAARDLRYGYLLEVAKQYACNRLAVAHTADDQAEEVLLRLIRGTGGKGLSGMDLASPRGVIRPFLQIPKKWVLDYLAAERISFCEDSSNRERVFLRNRIRLDLLPYLAEYFNPNIRETLRRTADVLNEDEKLLEELAEAACARALVVEDVDDLPVVHIPLNRFRAEPKAMQRRIMEKACWQMDCPPSFQHIEQLRSLACSGRDGAQIHLGRGLRVLRQGDIVSLSFPKGRQALRGDLAAEEGRLRAFIPEPGCFTVEGLDQKITVELLADVPDREALSARGVEFLDAATVIFPLTLSSAEPGDRFHPLGAPGGKKVSDFMIDRKIPRKERWRVPVLRDANGVLALIGLRLDQRCGVGPATRSVLSIRLQ